MQTLSPEEFQRLYGSEALSRFGEAAEPQDGAVADLKQGFADAKQSVSDGLDREKQIESEDRGVVSNLVGKFANGLRTSGEAIASVGEGAIRALPFGTKTMDAVEDTVASGAEAVASSKTGQAVGEIASSAFDSLPEGAQQTLGDVGNATIGSLSLAGTLVAPGVTNAVAKKTLASADDVLAKVKSAQPTVNSTNSFLKNAVDDVRYGLSEIDPQVETILKRSSTDEVNTYFQKAEQAKKDPSKATPLEVAGTKAEEAYDAIDEARKKAVQGKKAILAEVADERVSGNTLNEVMSSGIARSSDKFGVQISANGEITSIKGRTSTLDAKDAKLVGEYYSKLNSLGISPTVQEVDDFVDWAQSQLYKQSKTISKLETASDPVIRELQQTTGDLNSRLKDSVGNGYGEVNSRVAEMISIQDELSSALGADARKGGGLMKKLFSPTGGNTRQNFTKIQELTGIDLFKEATLAKYAMESVGDTRQKSLLQQLDVAVKDASELDLTRPTSIINFLRERADMDGQELANEIIRRTSDETQ